MRMWRYVNAIKLQQGLNKWSNLINRHGSPVGNSLSLIKTPAPPPKKKITINQRKKYSEKKREKFNKI